MKPINFLVPRKDYWASTFPYSPPLATSAHIYILVVPPPCQNVK